MKKIMTITVVALAATLLTGAALMAQNSPASDPGGQNLDVNAILQALGLGGALIGTGGTGTGTGTTGGNGIITGGGTTTTQPSEGTQPPTIVTNQFTTTSSAALQARNPGGWTRYAIGVQEGTNTITGGDGPPPTWVETLTDDIANTVLNTWSNIFAGINTFLGTLNGTGGTGTGGSSTIPNAATTGAGTTTPIARLLGL